MAPDFLELATTLKYLGAKWLPEKKLILRPAECISWYMGTRDVFQVLKIARASMSCRSGFLSHYDYVSDTFLDETSVWTSDQWQKRKPGLDIDRQTDKK